MSGTSPKSGGGGARKGFIIHDGTFERIISLENLFAAWREFRRGKRSKRDIQEFEFKLEDNIFSLHTDLATGSYRHGIYHQFYITDPKIRLISKATVRDRLLHHAIYRVLYPHFDPTFIHDSYSCRLNKGTHEAFGRLVELSRKISQNYTKPCFALKCDVKKFFDSVDHAILMRLLQERINDEKLLSLLQAIITSFAVAPGKGIPIGNLISQLFVNIYLDPLDKFVRHKLQAKYYLRYADDFLLLGRNPDELIGYFIEMNQFLKQNLKLSIHPDKIQLRKLSWGIDFVGYVALLHYSLPRRRTVKRILRKIENLMTEDPKKLAVALPSYLGYLQHVEAHRLSARLRRIASVSE